MVGAPTSKGCSACRKRKVRCDEAKPECKRCLKSGLRCPGYPVRLVFRDELPGLKARLRGRQRVVEFGSDDEAGSDAQLPGYSVLRLSTRQKRHHFENGLLTPLEHPLCSTEDSLARRFITFLELSPFVSKASINTYGGFFYQIPQRLGLNPALDEATTCLCNTHVDHLGNGTGSQEGQKHYAKALIKLQGSLNDSKYSTSSETLCATIMLQTYEVYSNPEDAGWVLHAGGASRLIEMRGPRLHRTGIDRAILESHRGGIIVDAIQQRKACFLADSSWAKMLDETEPLRNNLIAQRSKSQHELYQLIAKVPGLLKDATDLATLRNKYERISFEHYRILARTYNVQKSLSAWRAMNFGYQATQNASTGSQSLVSPSYSSTLRRPRYSHPVATAYDCLATINLIVLDCILCCLSPSTTWIRPERVPESHSKIKSSFDFLTLPNLMYHTAGVARTLRHACHYHRSVAPTGARFINFVMASYRAALEELRSEENKDMWVLLDRVWDELLSS